MEEVQPALQEIAAEASGLCNAVVQRISHLQTGLEQSTEKVRYAALHSACIAAAHCCRLPVI